MLPVFLGALILGGVVQWSSGSGWAGGISGPLEKDSRNASTSAGIGEREVAEDLRASCAEWLFTGEVVGALEVLGGLPDPARRLQALEDFDAGEARRFSRMSPGDVEILRARLEEWTATPEQVESLVNKYQRKK